MELDDLFTDGPYEGEQLEDLIEDQPWYIEQLVLEGFDFSKEAQELIKVKGLS